MAYTNMFPFRMLWMLTKKILSESKIVIMQIPGFSYFSKVLTEVSKNCPR